MWCSHCHYGSERLTFFNNHCYNCGRILEDEEMLKRNPLARIQKEERNKKEKPRKFQFDQKEGSNSAEQKGSGDLKSQMIDSVFELKGRV